MKLFCFHRSLLAALLYGFTGLVLVVSTFTGCGGGAAGSGPKAGPITVTFAGGSSNHPGAMVLSTSAQLSMSPVGDVLNAGVDWTVTCGGSPATGSVTGGACGTLAPAHTPAGTATLFIAPGLVPLGSTVTITASVTSNPSQSSTVTLTILPEPIAVALDLFASSVIVGGQVPLSATVANDPNKQGVTWSVTCGSNAAGACGTIVTAQFSASYTAPSSVPAGGTVTVTATSVSDPTKSASETIAILPKLSTNPANQISVNVLPVSFYTQTAGATHTTRLTAVATNDITPGGIDWTLSCGSSACGTVSPTHTASGVATLYSSPSTIPTGGTVTITATSTGDPTKSATSTAMVIASSPAPIVVTMSTPPPAKLLVNAAASLAATDTGDTKNLGLDWTATCGGTACGSFSLSPAHTASGGKITYTAPPTVPGGGTVTITATSSSTAPANNAFAITTIQSSVAFTQAPPLALVAGATATLAATVASDPGNLGLNWTATCGSSACGSFTPAAAHTSSGGTITYTAPSTVPPGSVVTITASSPATTPANTASAGTTILVVPPSITFTPAPPATMSGGTPVTIAATVANDVAPGGVVWTVKCGNTADGACGAIVPHQTASGAPAAYTAPPVTATGTTVTLVATSVSDPAVSLSSTPIAIVPNTTLSVSFVPAPPSQVQTNATVNLEAAVANDSTHAGVDWKVCASGCGFFTVKPANPGIAVPFTPAVPAVTATTVSGWPNAVPLPYTAPPQPPSSGIVTIAVAAHADPSITNSASISISNGVAGTALKGIVRAGSQPVVGASVALYAAGTNGYASAATALLSPGSSPLTDHNGNFTVPAGYTCPQPNSQLYVVATGGQSGGNRPNSDLALMTALGSCNSLTATPIVVNEVTTVASAWPLAPFSGNDLFGGNSSYLYLGASSTNQTGLANAFAAVNNLVDITTGQARYNVPAGNAAVPYVEINTIADMLNACTSTAGGVYGDGSPCSTLLMSTNISTGGQAILATQAADTLQLAFNIARNPTVSYGYATSLTSLFPLVTPASPFQPVLSTQPNDLSISLNYTGGGGLSSASAVGSFAIDASGNVWITDTHAGSVIEWNAVGAALSPATGFPAGGSAIAIDAGGDVWVSGSGGLVELTNFGTPYPGSPFTGVPGGGNDMAIDAQGNLWITNGTGIVEFNSFGMELSPAGGFFNNGVLNTGAVAVDSANHVWEENQVPGFVDNLADLTNPGGQLITNIGSQIFTSTTTPLAADASGNIWYSGPGNAGLCKMPPFTGTNVPQLPSCHQGGGGVDLPELNAQGVALDGSGTVWVPSAGGTQPFVGILPPNVLPFNPTLYGNVSFPGTFVSPSLAAGPLRAAIDGSGNIWVLLANNTVTEYVGLAVPVVTPIALGVKTNKLAAKP